MRILFILFTLICPLFFWVGKDLRQSQELFFQIASTCVILAGMFFLNVNPMVGYLMKRNKLNLWIGIFGIYSVILFLLGGCGRGSSMMFNIFVGCLIYFLTLSLQKRDTCLILKAIIWVCVINTLYMALQQCDFDFIYVIRGPDNTLLFDAKDQIGFFGIKAAMGIYTVIGLIATLIINPIIAMFFLLPVYLSKSTGAIAGLVVGMSFYFWWVKRRLAYWIMPLFCVLGLSYVVFVDNPMGMQGTRPPMWKMALKDTVYGFNLNEPQIQSPLLKNPLTGFGLDSFRNGGIKYFKIVETNTTIRGIAHQQRLLDEKGREFVMRDGHLTNPDGKLLDLWDNPHCLVVSIFYEFGLIGLLIMGFVIYYTVERFRRSFKSNELVAISAILLVLGVSSLFQFPFHLARIGYLLPIIGGLFVINTE